MGASLYGVTALFLVYCILQGLCFTCMTFALYQICSSSSLCHIDWEVLITLYMVITFAGIVCFLPMGELG